VTPASIPSPGFESIGVGPLSFHVYGLCYVLAVLTAVWICGRRWERMGGERVLAADVALVGFPAGLIGGRIYYLITSWSEVPDEWWGPFAVWKGGMGLPGGILAGVLGGIWVLRRRKVDVKAFMDAAAPAILVAQAIGRIGNWFNQELFGGPSSLPWAVEIDPEHRPERYFDSPTFHPTFLYEATWDLLLAGGLVWLGAHRTIRPPGLFALYLAGYGLFRMGMELLRVDPATHVLGLRLNFWVAALVFVAGVVWFIRSQRPARRMTPARV
jgi:prolipoprotein diacylglyceryl transferase